jgi:hypothetical protein
VIERVLPIWRFEAEDEMAFTRSLESLFQTRHWILRGSDIYPMP